MSALQQLAQQLREEDTPISPHVIDPDEAAAFAPPGEYAFVIEAVREGYLLHHGEPRLLAGHDPDLALLAGHDPDLALLAGDYLYALGIERLAAMGDTDAVHVLADLISTCAQLHTEDRGDDVPAVWERSIQQIVRP